MNPNSNKFVIWLAVLVSVGGILYGYDMGVISGALLFIKDSIPLTDNEMAWLVSIVLGGGLFGTVISGSLADYFGRRIVIALSALVFIFGVIAVLLATTFIVIFLGRLALGIGVGMVAVVVPLYVTEMVPSQDRGKYVTFFQLLLTFGIVLAYTVDLIFTPSGNWRAMFAVVLVPASILLFGSILLPESPRWLLANNRKTKAREVLQKIRDNFSSVDREISEISLSLTEVTGSWRDFFAKDFIAISLVAILVAVFNQLTGINSFLQYAPLILKNAGFASNVGSMLGSLGIGILNFAFTIVAVLLIDKVGRRPLLLTGVCGVMLAEIYLGIITYLYPVSYFSAWLALIGLLAFIIFFAIGPGVVVWLAISELFPTQIRGKGISVCLFFNSLAATILSAYFLRLEKYLGTAQTYWLFAFFTLCYLVVAFFFLPETKAKSLEQIQYDIQHKR